MDATAWAAVATAGAAVATAIAAGFTAWMAQRTSDLAAATRTLSQETQKMTAATRDEADAVAAQIEVSRHALEAQVRPWLSLTANRSNTWVTKGTYNGDPGGRLREWIEVRVEVENVGAGIALIERDGVKVFGHQFPEADPRLGKASSAVVAPGGSTLLITSTAHPVGPVPPWDSLTNLSGQGAGNDGELFVDVTYSDVSGGNGTTARVHFAYVREAKAFAVHRLSYRRPSDAVDAAFAVVDYLV